MVADIDKRNNKVVLSLGGNIGDVKSTFIRAIQQLEEKVGGVIQKSSLYKTKAWGVENQPDFFNQVLILNSFLEPEDILKKCMGIELFLGRVRKQKWYERTIDIDILFYNEDIISSEDLIVPHPLIQERNFVLFPLEEVASDLIHPVMGKSIKHLKIKCSDELEVIKY